MSNEGSPNDDAIDPQELTLYERTVIDLLSRLVEAQERANPKPTGGYRNRFYRDELCGGKEDGS